MRRLLTLALCISMVGVYAQKAEWGLKAGLQLTSFKGDDFKGIPNTSSSRTLETITTKNSTTIGYALGAYVRSTEPVFIQGEMLFSIKGAELERVGQNSKISIQYGQLDVPLSLGYQAKRWEVLGGLSVSGQIFDDGNLKKFLSTYSNSGLTFSPYRKYNFGYHVGAGLRFNRIGINARYMASIQPISDMYISYSLNNNDPQLSESKFSQRAGIVQFTLSYRLR